VRDISSCRKPRDAILSRIADLNASTNIRFLPAISGSGFAVIGAEGCLTPNISLALGNFTKKFHCFIPLPDLYKFPLPTISILLPIWGHDPPKKNCLLCFTGCEIANPARD